MIEMKKFTALASMLLVLTGCAVGPNYRRPKTDVPATYRGLAPDQAGQSEAASLGDQKWWEVFQDEQLQQLIRTALQQNYDVRIAATRILEAQAVLGITRADQYPSVAAGASTANQRTPNSRIIPPIESSPSQVNVSFLWELDFW